ncbi:MAG: hypothetical protein KAX53_01630 [Saprospiraceae bacterium]|nr:hypothetical protein [Saprospiraceae bacterium]
MIKVCFRQKLKFLTVGGADVFSIGLLLAIDCWPLATGLGSFDASFFVQIFRRSSLIIR